VLFLKNNLASVLRMSFLEVIGNFMRFINVISSIHKLNGLSYFFLAIIWNKLYGLISFTFHWMVLHLIMMLILVIFFVSTILIFFMFYTFSTF